VNDTLNRDRSLRFFLEVGYAVDFGDGLGGVGVAGDCGDFVDKGDHLSPLFQEFAILDPEGGETFEVTFDKVEICLEEAIPD
jgi:hypothetical protein